jgi:predicted O-methyltransferase YrrM
MEMLKPVNEIKKIVEFASLYENINSKTYKGVGFFNGSEVLDELVKNVKPNVILEVGSWMGHSGIHFAKKLKDFNLNTSFVLCVDTWLGSSEHWLNDCYHKQMEIKNGRPNFYKRFLQNIVASGTQDIVIPISLPSSVAYEIFVKLQLKADLIYIDAGHGYDDVTSDISKYYQLLSNKGIMFGDDYFHLPVRNAVNDFAKNKNLKAISASNRGHKWIYLKKDCEPKDFLGEVAIKNK